MSDAVPFTTSFKAATSLPRRGARIPEYGDLTVFLGSRWGLQVGSIKLKIAWTLAGRTPPLQEQCKTNLLSRSRLTANRGPSSLAQRGPFEVAVGSGSGGVSPHPAAVGPDGFQPSGTAVGSGWSEDSWGSPRELRRSLWMVGRWLSLS